MKGVGVVLEYGRGREDNDWTHLSGTTEMSPSPEHDYKLLIPETL